MALRVALGLVVLVAGLGLVLGSSAGVGAEGPEALELTLTAGRPECTAGTLNPVTWEIRDGVGPYRLTVDGASVDADAESATVTCGALPDYGLWLPVTEAPATITAVVTDATGSTATASAAYTIVPPLPAPVATADPGVQRFSVKFAWEALTVPASCEAATGCFAFRTRLAGETSWDYSWDEHRNADSDWPPLVYRSVAAGTTVEAGIASIRDPIEIETPEALNWSATAQATSLTDINGLTATATHDTVTVHWNRQPSATFWRALVSPSASDGGAQFQDVTSWDIESWGNPASGIHEVVFTQLPTDTEFVVAVTNIGVDWEEPVTAGTTIRTAVAPPDHTPLVRGPQNLRATATHDTITVRWDHPRADVEEDYWLHISSSTGRVPFRHQNAFVLPPDSAYTYTDLTPGSTYRIRVTHIDITRESAEITITTAAAAPPLRLALTAGRAECTAATLNPVTWEIRGGVGPYRLTVDGASVDADAEGATATCGALPDGASTAPATITAVVTDATGSTATASAAYTIVPPLPAPTGLGYYAERTQLGVWWDRVAAAGPVPTGSDCPCPLYLVRWRVAGAGTWETALHWDRDAGRSGPGRRFYDLTEGTAYEWAVATLRGAIEQETPTALNWSATATATTVAPPTGVRATATHDTITVTWAPQPAAPYFTVGLRGPDGSTSQTLTADGATPHQVVFRHLPPDTEYTVAVRSRRRMKAREPRSRCPRPWRRRTGRRSPAGRRTCAPLSRTTASRWPGTRRTRAPSTRTKCGSSTPARTANPRPPIDRSITWSKVRALRRTPSRG